MSLKRLQWTKKNRTKKNKEKISPKSSQMLRELVIPKDSFPIQSFCHRLSLFPIKSCVRSNFLRKQRRIDKKGKKYLHTRLHHFSWEYFNHLRDATKENLYSREWKIAEKKYFKTVVHSLKFFDVFASLIFFYFGYSEYLSANKF